MLEELKLVVNHGVGMHHPMSMLIPRVIRIIWPSSYSAFDRKRSKSPQNLKKSHLYRIFPRKLAESQGFFVLTSKPN